MGRVLLFALGIVLALMAETILWLAPDLCALTDGWHSAVFTRLVGVGVVMEGALCTLGAALCFGRAVSPLGAAPTQGGPVLPICGILFLLAAFGPCGQALKASSTLTVMESEPGSVGPDIVDDFRQQKYTAWTLFVLWLGIGGTLLGAPLFMEPQVWRLGWPINGTGCAIAVVGCLLSALGAFVCFANALAMEGASADVNFAGQLGVLVGAFVAVTGSIIAVRGR